MAKAFLATTKVQRNIVRAKTFSCLFMGRTGVINGFLGIVILGEEICKTKVAKALFCSCSFKAGDSRALGLLAAVRTVLSAVFH